MSRLLHEVPQNSASFQQQTCPDTTTVRTFTPPAGAAKSHAALITVETNAARVTFNGATPDAAHGVVVQAAQQPLYVPFATAIKAVSTIAGNAIVNVTWLS
jgi:hypothetical protein